MAVDGRYILENSFSARLKSDSCLMGSNVTDIGVLNANGSKTIIVTDCNDKRVKRFYEHHGNMAHSWLDVESEPRGLAKIADNTVVVSLHGSRELCFIRVDSEMYVSSRVNADKEYYGLSSIDANTIAASAPWHHPPTVDVIDTEGKVLVSINKDADGKDLFASPKYLTVTPSRDILVSDIMKISLTCVTSSGKVKWVFQPNDQSVLAEPRGVACNTVGEIFLADNNEHKILKLSPDGVFLSNVFTRVDNMVWPVGICVDSSGKLYITQSEGEIKVYTPQ
ncbi:uncharacterized protein LOC121378070 [Gigantopelta aegis]|uniref:uncharacterized protein LOC121378070 n=1 Tax=Gigantopelta aegis TaxID=1735272 RepID=UPI001B889785|nr:uncharacterized protein LOC121378070 [Gigantopelta aegis]